MTTPALLTGSPVVLSGEPVSPSSVIDAKTMGASKLGEVLKNLVVRSGAFHSEVDVQAAHEAIDSFVKAFSTGNPFVGDEHRAKVANRPDPTAPAPVPVVTSLPPIDYNALARAIVAAQQGG